MNNSCTLLKKKLGLVVNLRQIWVNYLFSFINIKNIAIDYGNRIL